MKNLLSLRTIAEAGYNANIPLIERAMVDLNPQFRAAALGSIHRLGKLDSHQFLLALTDNDVQVRRRAVELASRIDLSQPDRSRVIEGLANCLEQEDEIAEVAAFSLGEIGSAVPNHSPEQADELLTPEGLSPEVILKLEYQARHHDNALCREQAVASLGALHSSETVILDALNDKATVRRRAVIALAPFSGPAVELALKDALGDRDWQVRQAAEDLLTDHDPDHD